MKGGFFIVLFFLLFGESLQIIAQKDTMMTTEIKNGMGLVFSSLYSKQTINNPIKIISGGISGSGGISYFCALDKERNIYLSAELGYLYTRGMLNTNYVTVAHNYTSTTYNSVTPFSLINRSNYIYFSATIQKIILKLPKSFYLLGGVGIQMNHLYSYSSETKGFIDSSTGKNINYKWPYTANYTSASLIAKLSLFKKVSKKISIIFSPIFYYGIKSNFLYGMGANFQLLYNI